MPDKTMIGGTIIVVSAAIAAVVGGFQLFDRFWAEEPIPDPPTPLKIVARDVPLSEVEQNIANVLLQDLAVRGCSDLMVTDLRAVQTVTAAEESTSTFVGYHVEGSTVVSGGSGPVRLPLVGTGKGPPGSDRSVEMAVENAIAEFETSDLYETHCEGN